jgi:elongation factor Ts
VVEKIVAGKMEKFYAENCLPEQPFVKDPERTVQQVIEEVGRVRGRAARAPLRRFVLGESLSA